MRWATAAKIWSATSKPVGLVDGAEIIDRHDHEAERAALAGRTEERVAERVEEVRAVEIAGQLVEAGQEREALLALIALVDDAEHTVGPRRALALAAVPAADILDP